MRFQVNISNGSISVPQDDIFASSMLGAKRKIARKIGLVGKWYTPWPEGMDVSKREVGWCFRGEDGYYLTLRHTASE